ncbi:unnamed protein product [Rhizophagus irregularis]|nr:unnamed protein product [Rhizophagus irregularis]
MTVLFILGNVKTRILERNRFQNTVFTQTRWAEVDKVNNEMMLRRDSSDRKNATKLVTIFSSIYSPYPPIHLFDSEFQESFNIINVFLFYFFGTGVWVFGICFDESINWQRSFKNSCSLESNQLEQCSKPLTTYTYNVDKQNNECNLSIV